jgi:hypothetical protein
MPKPPEAPFASDFLIPNHRRESAPQFHVFKILPAAQKLINQSEGRFRSG